MPPEYRDTKMIILCNDCLKESKVPFHVFGGKCSKCRSYNTTRIDDDKNKPEDWVDKDPPAPQEEAKAEEQNQ